MFGHEGFYEVSNIGRVRNGSSKLTKQDVRKIVGMRACGATYKAIGVAFRTHWSNVWLICNGKSWKHARVNA